ncbi:uncharacterized protein LOC129216533 [Uloborus diversus]|uniref:uncharacterized protein LOC129216533 n=1 Tax=Uloborus diversus TaxID=327109 RepID=UPI00240A7280|nr:uncharacterized protein LOC129216533 [Uloborus diversus]
MVKEFLSKDHQNLDEQVALNLPYRNLLGCLAFLVTRTRPDIMYAVNVLSQYQQNPLMDHWKSLVKLFNYVLDTESLGLDLARARKFRLSCYSDAAHAQCLNDRKSIIGNIIFLDNVPVNWRTAKQKCVATSSMESEYIALVEAAKEILWFTRICREVSNLDIQFDESLLFCDNTAAIDFANSPIENKRTRHIDINFQSDGAE